MKKDIVKTKFNFSFGKLKQQADETVNLIDRDILEFTDRGYTAARRTEFINAIAEFHDFPTDEQMDGIKQTATEEKDKARDVVESKMRTMFLAAKNVFGLNSGKYREFGNPDLTSLNDANLSRDANMMVTTAGKYLTLLAAEGVTPAKITALDDAQKEFDKKIDEQKTAISNRDNSTEDRAKLANVVYDLLVKYCETGRDIWYETSEAKYNDYIIYNTPSGTDDDGGSADALSGTVNPSTVKTVTSVDEDATITMSNTGTEKLYFALSPTEGAGGIDFTVQAGETLVKSTAEMSPDGDGTFLLVKNPEAVAGSYEVIIDF
ncbi:MAG: hypothetical protein U0U67_14320 [Chitinophagales bacterium]